MLLQGVRSEELPILQGIEFYFVDVAPAPVLTRLGGLHDGVAARVEVFRRVLVLGGVATTDVAAGQTKPEMHPPVPGRQALFAALQVGRNRPDLLDVRTGLLAHYFSPPLKCLLTASYISFRYS